MSDAVGQQPVYLTDRTGFPVDVRGLLEGILDELQKLNTNLTEWADVTKEE